MTTIWKTQSQLYLEYLEGLAEWLGSDAPKAPAALEEQTARLLAMAVTLLRQHHVNKRGQCQFCGWTRWKWRFWRRRRRCTVHQTLNLAMSQSLEVVWWRVFEGVGQKQNLAEVRTWVAERVASEMGGCDDDGR